MRVNGQTGKFSKKSIFRANINFNLSFSWKSPKMQETTRSNRKTLLQRVQNWSFLWHIWSVSFSNFIQGQSGKKDEKIFRGYEINFSTLPPARNPCEALSDITNEFNRFTITFLTNDEVCPASRRTTVGFRFTKSVDSIHLICSETHQQSNI